MVAQFEWKHEPHDPYIKGYRARFYRNGSRNTYKSRESRNLWRLGWRDAEDDIRELRRQSYA